MAVPRGSRNKTTSHESPAAGSVRIILSKPVRDSDARAAELLVLSPEAHGCVIHKLDEGPTARSFRRASTGGLVYYAFDRAKNVQPLRLWIST